MLFAWLCCTEIILLKQLVLIECLLLWRADAKRAAGLRVSKTEKKTSDGKTYTGTHVVGQDARGHTNTYTQSRGELSGVNLAACASRQYFRNDYVIYLDRSLGENIWSHKSASSPRLCVYVFVRVCVCVVSGRAGRHCWVQWPDGI